MNKDTKIKVRTTIGETEEKDTGENIGQGTLEGAVISSANIDYDCTVDKFFRKSTDELSFGGIKLQPLLFQDDISRQSTSFWAAQSGNNKIEAVMETKLLDFILDKSCYIVMGSKKNKLEIETELKSNPLTLSGKVMNNVQTEKMTSSALMDLLIVF